MKSIHSVLGCVLLLTACGVPYVHAEESIAGDRDQRMEWWRDAQYGMFVHWGLYSGLAGEWDGKSLGSSGNMEWAQHRAKVDTDTYAEQAIPLFKPKQGFATEWARLAKQAGCKYLVFTTKHHDGFALHDSQVSDFDAGSVLNRDLVREIVDACRAEGLKVGFYHSVIDWHHDQFAYADSEKIPHPLRGQPYPNGTRDHQKYIDYLHKQTEELVTGYGPIDILWWDYSVEDFQGEQAWDAFRLIDMVKQHQPQVIMNNRLFRRPEAGMTGTSKSDKTASIDPTYGDFMTPEQRVPDTGMPDVDWETCMTMNTTWGYSKHDHNWKSTETLLHTLIDAASKGGNLLLNVGPMADGTIPQQSVQPLKEVGQWLATNGEAIYGTTASPIAAPEWGRITAKPDQGVLYLHVFDWPEDGRLTLEGLPNRYSEPMVLDGEQQVAIDNNGSNRALDLSQVKKNDLVTVIRLQDTQQTSTRQTADKPPAETNKRLHSDGSAWGYKHHEDNDSKLPRVLLIGDSILNGYRSHVIKELEGEAIVDTWVNPHFQSEQFNKLLGEQLQQDTYDVVHFNIGLHGWQEGRIKPGTFKPLTKAMVEVIQAKQPDAKLIWASSTPVTVKGKPEQLDPEINSVIVEHNRMAAEVMDEMQVPVNDFYGLLVKRLELARGDQFHWQGPAYKTLGNQTCKAIRSALAKQSE
ncbi:alpha-L-fucosidase [Aeoliella sp. ICT_H6.2]|uniref:alpha-L-fucosidase n=1 Tax=Aeoliella straminimaris TaxID=2954799 RepID=A0A9X2FEX8_9BACT|nr:alpha-L-fucosidase [Aeoliella straminimaris]MCO6047454.1 alpha-L-fucosidase [Aeoliella straminimaris]